MQDEKKLRSQSQYRLTLFLVLGYYARLKTY
jgi:hypothetical protein